MNYELYKQLKDAGFPQYPIEVKDGTPGYAFIPQKGDSIHRDGKRFYVPTLSELIEACGDDFTNLALVTKKYIGNFEYKDLGRLWVTGWVTNGVNDLEDEWETEGQTPEEAVASLWLALNNKE